MLRKLGIFERALYLSDLHAPFNVVSVLQLENAPSSEIVRAALVVLQGKHRLLRARIHHGAFEELPSPAFDFQILDRLSDHQWLDLANHEMNTRLDPSGCLFRGAYLFREGRADLILTFHHAIIDAVSGVSLLDELLGFCAGQKLFFTPGFLPPLEERYPATFKGWRGMAATLKYTARQMADEMTYRVSVRGKRIPPVKLGGRGFAMTLALPESRVNELSQRGRREKVTLNTLLNAAQLLAVNRQLYAGKPTPMRTFTFADLRPYTDPPTSATDLANYISMLRFTLDVSGKDDLWQLAKRLHERIYPALKYGDKFIAYRMSEAMMKLILAKPSMRMGASGLNYSGIVPLRPAYGSIQVTGLHGFLSSFDLGPEVSSQARIFNHQLLWDFMFLESDMDRQGAENIIEEIKSILASPG